MVSFESDRFESWQFQRTKFKINHELQTGLLTIIQNNKQSTKNKMNNKKAITTTPPLFFDRLPSVHRKKSNGQTTALKGNHPLSICISNEFEERRDDKSSLVYGRRATTSVRIKDLCSTLLLEARIDHDIDHVSVDGNIALYCLIQKNTRFYSLSFFIQKQLCTFAKVQSCF